MTTMRLERTVEGDLRFFGVVSTTDFARLKLDHFDRVLLADCEGEGRSAADWLLALETIFRRMREQGLAGVGANFKCVYCGWVGAVNPSDPACGNSRCVEPYPGKCAHGARASDGEAPAATGEQA